jgi:ABC-type transport system involved in multi-copper enzyme maturation permease subunit
MFWNILRLESDKFFRRRLLWLGLIIAITPLVIFLFVSFYAGRSVVPPRYLIWPGGAVSALSLVNGYSPGYGYGAYLLAIVVGVVTAQEYSWRTMQLWLSHGIARPLLLTVKFVTSLGLVVVIVLAFLLIGSVISLILAFQLHGSVDFSQVNGGQLFLSFLRTSYGLLPYASLAFLLAVVSRSVVVSVVGVILFMLAIELPLTGILPSLGKNYALIAQYLPANLAQSMNVQNYAAAKLPSQVFISAGQASPAVAAICIALYTLGLFCSALWVFQHQDLTS